eukprot:TRINITY_DN842_c0_g1_i1.p1 TRINITY_DN842_c0_g1~~TRINITY_DN842_c0_g1_i1.p1  ORF type:complete len:318 (-),score=132.73 TRINITY_DN842_c0_g1_i1:141-1094(-)
MFCNKSLFTISKFVNLNSKINQSFSIILKQNILNLQNSYNVNNYKLNRSYGTRPFPKLPVITRNPSDIRLDNLRNVPGAVKPNVKPLGRGPGSTKGKSAGRGQRGQNSRSGGGVSPGFIGGQSPFYLSARKYGFRNKFRVKFRPLNLNRLQYWIDTGRIDPEKTITLKTLRDSGCSSKKIQRIKLLAEGYEWFKAKINIEVSQASSKAIKTVESLGGTVTRVYFNDLGLRTFLKKKTEDIKINFARCPRKVAKRYDVNQYVIPGREKPPITKWHRQIYFGDVPDTPGNSEEHRAKIEEKKRLENEKLKQLQSDKAKN